VVVGAAVVVVGAAVVVVGAAVVVVGAAVVVLGAAVVVVGAEVVVVGSKTLSITGIYVLSTGRSLKFPVVTALLTADCMSDTLTAGVLTSIMTLYKAMTLPSSNAYTLTSFTPCKDSFSDRRSPSATLCARFLNSAD
jgi:hypothetical protein